MLTRNFVRTVFRSRGTVVAAYLPFTDYMFKAVSNLGVASAASIIPLVRSLTLTLSFGINDLLACENGFHAMAEV